MQNNTYEVVIGLEIHAQLQTNTKLFCGDSVAFGANANTHISAITLGHPGTLPKTNSKVIEYAIKLGLACNCSIVQKNYFARKNYFYPDLPKGYQISQHTTPICIGGFVDIVVDNMPKKIELNRIHIEEDAGKSIHDLYDNFSCIDLNRAGTALLEIVTEPCLHSANEAYEYVTEVRKLVRWLGICDGNMEEGSLRCDVNVSLRLKGATTLGTKVEVKNVNSIKYVKKAIEAEVKRMTIVLDNGGTIVQQTRGFDVATETTVAIRDKEDANDYRYFADPDLCPFDIEQSYIDAVKNNMPILPNKLIETLVQQYQLSVYDASQICEDNQLAQYFLNTSQLTNNYKAIANFINGPIKQYLNENNLPIENIANTTVLLANLIKIIDDGIINFSVAATKILPIMFAKNEEPLAIAQQLNLTQTNNTNEIESWIDTTLNNMPDKVAEYKKGKKGLIGLFVGEVKKLSNGKADPKIVTQLLQQKLG
jgi:aspartyl-tRNA(Asn)/glutamyl-tRNA(Gln) amidotransferase subunit B